MGQVYGLYPDEEEKKKPATGLATGSSGNNAKSNTTVTKSNTATVKTTPSQPVLTTSGKASPIAADSSSGKPITRPNRFDNGEDIGSTSSPKNTGSSVSKNDKIVAETEALRKKGTLTPQEKQKYNDNLTYLKTASVYEKQQGNSSVIADYLKNVPQQSAYYNTPEYWREVRSSSPVDAALLDTDTLLKEGVLTSDERKRLDQNVSALSKVMNDSRSSADLKNVIKQTLDGVIKRKQKEFGLGENTSNKSNATGKSVPAISAAWDENEKDGKYPLTMGGLRNAEHDMEEKRQKVRDALPEHVREALESVESIILKDSYTKEDKKNYEDQIKILEQYSAAEKIGHKEGELTPIIDFLQGAPSELRNRQKSVYDHLVIPEDFDEEQPLLSKDVRTGIFAINHPVEAGMIGWVQPKKGRTDITNNAVRFATNDLGLKENDIGEGSQVNSFRHVLWQAAIANAFGENIAKEAGAAHEKNPNLLKSIKNINNVQFENLSLADEAVDIHE